MKLLKVHLLLVALLALAFGACQNPSADTSAASTAPKGDSSQPVPVAPSTPVNALPTEGLRIAWVNMDSVLHAYDYYFEMERQMTELTTKADKELTEKGRALEKKVADFQDKAQKGLLTRSEMQQTQEALAAEQNNFLQLQQSRRQSLVEEEQVRLRKVQSAITDFINRYNVEHGYNFILSAGLLYGDPRLSVTKEVIEGLNREYADLKKSQSAQ